MTPHALLAPARLASLTVLRGQDDGRLVDLTRAGCEPAFEAIVARYRRPLLRYCHRLVPDDRAEDVVQQAFLRAYDAMLRDGAELDLRPWLYRIVHNTALNALRDRASRHEPLHEDIDGAERPDQAAERRQRIRDALAGVRELPERQRDAILLRELEGRSYEEIAGALGVSGGAVRQLLNRARTTLRAGAGALTPAGLLARLPWAAPAEPGARVAELCGGAGAGAAVAKVCATALVTGAVVGGAAVAPGGHAPNDSAARSGGSGAPSARRDAPPASAALADLRGGVAEDRRFRGAAGVAGSGSGSDDHRGRHRGGSGSDGGSSGPSERSGSGHGSRSGNGSGSSGSGSGSSGSGSGSSGSGSGSGSSGSGGSGPSGSASSGSGSGSSGSGSSGGSSDSGSSGSGSSGSGSGSGSSGSGSGSSVLSSGSGSSGSGSGSSGSGTSGEASADRSGSSGSEG